MRFRRRIIDNMNRPINTVMRKMRKPTLDKNFNIRKRVIEITLRFTQKQNALMQSFLLICHAIVHSSASKELEKTVLDLESILNPHNLNIDNYYSGMLLINIISETELYFVDIIKEVISVYPQKIGKEKFELSVIINSTTDELILQSAENYIDGAMRKKPK